MRPRMTALRKTILNIIETTSTPVSARWLQTRLTENPNPSTVYRALDYLETHALVQSVSFSRVKFYFMGREKGGGHFIFCKNCCEIQAFEDCLVRSYQHDEQICDAECIANH